MPRPLFKHGSKLAERGKRSVFRGELGHHGEECIHQSVQAAFDQQGVRNMRPLVRQRSLPDRRPGFLRPVRAGKEDVPVEGDDLASSGRDVRRKRMERVGIALVKHRQELHLPRNLRSPIWLIAVVLLVMVILIPSRLRRLRSPCAYFRRRV